MSMPQYLTVAVVSTTARGLKLVQGVPALSASGVVPRYILVTLKPTFSMATVRLKSLQANTVGLWVALDAKALQACQALPAYSRGFYDHWLPERAVLVSSRVEFEALTKKIWEAFCASS